MTKIKWITMRAQMKFEFASSEEKTRCSELSKAYNEGNIKFIPKKSSGSSFDDEDEEVVHDDEAIEGDLKDKCNEEDDFFE